MTAKSFRLIDEFVREATSFSKDDIASVQKFANDIKNRGLFKERSVEDKARLEAEMKALADAWGESIQALEDLSKGGENDDDSGDDEPAPGQRQL